MTKAIPTQFFDMVPIPILVADVTDDPFEQNLVYLNPSFAEKIGWSIEEIPNKEKWWKTAYPDPQYQKVVERLWEVNVDAQSSGEENFVIMSVNIMTKHRGTKRFKVYTELQSSLLEGYHVVAFEEIEEEILI